MRLFGTGTIDGVEGNIAAVADFEMIQKNRANSDVC